MKDSSQNRILLGSLAGLVAARALLRSLRKRNVKNQVVVITGGSKGLGFELARQLVLKGCRVAICGRNEADLEIAEKKLRQLAGPARSEDVLARRCDVSVQKEVQIFVKDVLEHLGRVDVQINNAGIMEVGAIEEMKAEDFQRCMYNIFYGALYPTLEVLQPMRQQRRGQIVNITSIGGVVPVPHLVPYEAAKFATVGLSESMTPELKRQGIDTTTVIPGLMRTGSFLNAHFHAVDEYKWFSIGASLPFLSMDVKKAAARIIRAIEYRERVAVIGLPARAAYFAQRIAPRTTLALMSLVNRVLLPPPKEAQGLISGFEARDQLNSGVLDKFTALGRKAAQTHQHLNQKGERAAG